MLCKSYSLVGQPVYDDKDHLDYAIELYNKGAFEAARSALSRFTLKSPELSYYSALVAIKAGHTDGEILVQEFLDNYGNHIYAKKAKRELADHFFTEGEYKEALAYYQQSSGDFDPVAIFNQGYCEFELNKYDNALTTFERLEGTFSSQQKDAAYFQGFIFYDRGDDENANKYLNEALDSKNYKVSAIILIGSIRYKNQDFKGLLSLLDKEKDIEKNLQVLQLMADASFELEKYKSAGESYQELLKHQECRNTLNYLKGGLCHFKTGNEATALEYLSKSAIAEDSISAYASYYLGILHAKRNNVEFAITSFENCAKYETRLKEEALYHQTSNLMLIPNYETVIEVANDYLEEYPNGKYLDEVNQLISIAYNHTNNYDLAIAYIEKLDRLTPQLKRTYQRTAFLKGANLFNDKNFQASVDVFQKALIHDMDQEITQKTFYWMAEAQSLIGNMDEALFYYKSVATGPDSEIYLKSIYGRSYVYFNLKDYDQASEGFLAIEKNVSGGLENYKSDVWVRLGDCMFAKKMYQEGIRYYKKVEQGDGKNKDYILFQIGLLYRYLDDDDKAKAYFKRLINLAPGSERASDAYFQLAQIEFENDNSTEAIERYKTFLNKYPKNQLVPFALLNQAVAYDNIGDSNASIANYKSILDGYPRHQTANSALLGLQDKHGNGQFDEFSQYLQRYKAANPNSEALESIEFETARSNYYSQNYEQAISGLKQFIINYPKSALILDATFFMGESYFRMEQWDNALVTYKQLSMAPEYGKYSKVLYRLASLYSQSNDLDQGNLYYHKLAKASNTNRNKLYVLNGLMQNYYSALTYDSAIYYGELLLSNPRVDAWVGSNAHLIVGKSYYQLGNLNQAKDSFLPLVSNTPDEHGAEANYYISKIYFDQAKYENALESLFTLTNNFQAYENWMGAAYLLMADIYIETNELFQAKATLESLIDHSESDEIKSEAREKLETIQDQTDNNE